MNQTKTKTKYPSAVYAAAGVGDLVYAQLRKLQDKAVAFGSEQAPQWKRKVADLSVKVDADKVRESVVTGTQFAAQKATEVYDTLVARGEKAFAAEEPKADTPTTETPKADAPKADTPKAQTNGAAAPKTAQPTVPVAPVAKKAQSRKRP
ncbi:hypothetical protein [Allorhizocola rhizosphaerae]|uniref:hypothetical protein n=1 Tax=Allorhizocola rhizosphaerae TaxID=1872709 RepID=UPI0013C30400|nr:hypothetical protein [Allorhizocola rhizosphaerae]